MNQNSNSTDAAPSPAETARRMRRLESLTADHGETENVSDFLVDEKSFGIRAADTVEGRNRASMLINKMYAWRGYAGTHRVDDDPNRITLSAQEKGLVIGTVSLGFDSAAGLLADEVFKDRVDEYRHRGGKLCEITKLAFDPAVRSKAALASLFHVLFIYGRYLHHCTDVFIEINPRHRRFYEVMLGFQRISDLRSNPRVDAPAYLLWASVDFIAEQIRRHGGTADREENERSLFPYFFSQREEEGIVRRLTLLG